MRKESALEKIKNFFTTSIVGGLLVILPVVILFFAIRWLYNLLISIIRPVTDVIVRQTGIYVVLGDLIVLGGILSFCFALGAAVKTQVGRSIYDNLEEAILKRAPGYTFVKETILLFFGRKTPPFSHVALVRVFSNDTMMTAFVTDEHPDGSYTVFVPTAPNPTSGNIFHLNGEDVYPMEITVESGLRTILSCGLGSTTMVEQVRRAEPDEQPSDPDEEA